MKLRPRNSPVLVFGVLDVFAEVLPEPVNNLGPALKQARCVCPPWCSAVAPTHSCHGLLSSSFTAPHCRASRPEDTFCMLGPRQYVG